MYLALMDDAVLPLNRPLWKIKIPLKVKVFLWLLHRGVILTKDNLAKRNWNGSKLCSCCQNDETISHLFFNCQMACLLWRIISITFGLSKPNSVVHLFGTWLQGLKRRQKNIMFPGLCALLWAIGCLEMILFSIKLKNKLFFRFFSGLHTSPGCGRFFKRRRTGKHS